MIYVSTGGLSNSTGYQTAMSFAESGLKNLELSGGAYGKDYLRAFPQFLRFVTFKFIIISPPKSPLFSIRQY